MKSIVFRSYDIRGKVGIELNLGEIYNLGLSIGEYFSNLDETITSIAIGCDFREHSEYIKQELTEAILSYGINVIYIGICTTPALYFSLNVYNVQAGIMVTASHNSGEYNGIKISLSKNLRVKLDIQKIKSIYFHKSFDKNKRVFGKYSENFIINKYVNWLAKHFEHLYGFDKPLVMDCLSGTSSLVMPLLADKLNFKNIKFINLDPDPKFSKLDPDPTVDKNLFNLKAAIKENDYAGIAFDGDSDRMSVFYKDKILSGDILISLFGWDILQQNNNIGILADIKASKAVKDLINSWGGEYYQAPSGHALIKDKIFSNKNILFAGEVSCHFFFKDRYFGYDDGIYAALRFIEIINKYDKPLDELISWYPKMYTTNEIRINYKDDNYINLIQKADEFFCARKEMSVNYLDGIKAIAPYGWGLIRKSNTESILSLRFESESDIGLKKIKEDFCEILEGYIDMQDLTQIKQDIL